MGVVLRMEDFERDDDYERGMTMNWAANANTVGTKNMMGMYVEIPAGSSNPAHYHENAEALAFVISGHARLVSGGEEFIVRDRTFCYTPPGELHQWFNLSDTDPIIICGIYGGVNRIEDIGTVFPDGNVSPDERGS